MTFESENLATFASDNPLPSVASYRNRGSFELEEAGSAALEEELRAARGGGQFDETARFSDIGVLMPPIHTYKNAGLLMFETPLLWLNTKSIIWFLI